MNDTRLAGLIIREKDPENLEYPFSTLDSVITPNDRFFVRSHFPSLPPLEARSWRLRVEGAVDRPYEIGYDDLLKMPSRTLAATIECAGNGRIFLSPKARGLQWEMGAVGTAEWTGTPLAGVLERAGVQKGAVEVVLEGADTGEITEEPKSPGKISFSRSIPLAKALQPEVLLAYRMNGKDLTPSHGFPVRAVVPGWYGMASVKWLVRVIVTDRPFTGYFQTADYAYWARRDGLPAQRIPVGEVEVKAQIARPARHEAIPAGTVYRVHGTAWGGESEVVQVELSADGGHTWEAAEWRSARLPYSWRLWEYAWRTPDKPGNMLLMARATDAQGHTQPMERDAHRATYMISHVLPIPVEIIPAPAPAIDAWEI